MKSLTTEYHLGNQVPVLHANGEGGFRVPHENKTLVIVFVNYTLVDIEHYALDSKCSLPGIGEVFRCKCHRLLLSWSHHGLVGLVRIGVIGLIRA